MNLPARSLPPAGSEGDALQLSSRGDALLGTARRAYHRQQDKADIIFFGRISNEAGGGVSAFAGEQKYAHLGAKLTYPEARGIPC